MNLSTFNFQLSTSNFQLSTVNCRLHFKQPAGTSRGVYNYRDVWYVKIQSDDCPERWGIGECAPLPNLSCDASPDYERALNGACLDLKQKGFLDRECLRLYPSILFGLETAIRHYETGSFAFWNTPFARGENGIPINGLIWMGDYRSMLNQIETKIAAGFRCIKLKIGAIDFEEELALLRHIRNRFSVKDIQVRVDANGAFKPDEAPDKLKRLAELDIHSIEQPIRAGQWEKMAYLTAATSLSIALDEELIGIHGLEEKRKLLVEIRPCYIVLKPSLHGGFCGCNEWIEEAGKQGIGWWITSALESNIGLNAIAQWCATFDKLLPQGLGTGQLFSDNLDFPLFVRQDRLWYSPKSNSLPVLSDKMAFSAGKISLFIQNRHSGLQSFLAEWFNDSPTLTVQTSGSTGIPKLLTVYKEKMIQSARLTCSFLNLKEGDSALLCLPLQYIAGKMMIVRAIIAGLDLIVRDPSGNPLADVKTPLRFAAMTPMQVYNSLQVPEEKARLMQIEILLIGGGAIAPELSRALNGFTNVIYSTYGMTETLSHIALRRLNEPNASDYYTPLPSVKLALSPENTLIIEALSVSDAVIYTNDIAEILPDGRFRILGRKDNIINSGGIKIQVEEIEKALGSVLSGSFAVTAVPHPQFGEAMVLLMPYDQAISQEQIDLLLPAFRRPKYLLKTENIPLTETGKIDRTACKKLALSLVPS